MAAKGYINGYYYPLVPQEHMDDPRSEYCLFKDDESLEKMSNISVVLKKNKITKMQQRWERRKEILANLNYGPWQVSYYTGWRNKAQRGLEKIRRLLHV